MISFAQKVTDNEKLGNPLVEREGKRERVKKARGGRRYRKTNRLGSKDVIKEERGVREKS